MAHVIELAKMIANRVWADAPLASLRQLPDVGKDYASQLAGAGVVSLKDIERIGPRCIEQVI